MKHNISDLLCRIVLDFPFWASLVCKLNYIPNPNIPTACTDGTTCWYNPAFFDSLTGPEVAFVLAHEAGHCAFNHLPRAHGRDPEKWNVAADYMINLLLSDFTRDKSIMAMPRCGLINPRYADLSVEEIYALLPDPHPQSSSGHGQGDPSGSSDQSDGNDQPQPPTFPGDLGSFIPPTSPDAREQLANDWSQALVSAIDIAQRGSVPDSVLRASGLVIAPPVPWPALLREWLRQSSRDDCSWTRPNRRYLASGFALPSLHSETVKPAVIAIDTSGSITSSILDIFSAEVQSFLDEVRPPELHILWCDTRVTQHLTLTPGDTFAPEFHPGGGGTAFEPVFQKIQELDLEESISGLVYLTDLCGSFPDIAPQYPVLWLNFDNNDHAPFGQTERIQPL